MKCLKGGVRTTPSYLTWAPGWLGGAINWAREKGSEVGLRQGTSCMRQPGRSIYAGIFLTAGDRGHKCPLCPTRLTNAWVPDDTEEGQNPDQKVSNFGIPKNAPDFLPCWFWFGKSFREPRGYWCRWSAGHTFEKWQPWSSLSLQSPSLLLTDWKIYLHSYYLKKNLYGIRWKHQRLSNTWSALFACIWYGILW